MQFSMQFTVVVVMEPDGRESPHVLHTLVSCPTRWSLYCFLGFYQCTIHTSPHPVIHPIPSNPIPSEMAFSNLHIYMAAVSFVVCTKVVREYRITNWEEWNFSCWGIIYIVEKKVLKKTNQVKYIRIWAF